MPQLPVRARRALRRLADPAHVRALVRRGHRGVAERGERDDEHLRLLLAFTLSADAHCIDVGAHQGNLLRHMMELAPAGRHLAYEPLPELAAELEAQFPKAEVRTTRRTAASGAAPSQPMRLRTRSASWSSVSTTRCRTASIPTS
jgi:hypothetical protein